MRFKRKLPLSDDEKSLEAIEEWFKEQQESLLDYKNKFRNQIKFSLPVTNHKFEFFTPDDLDKYFDESKNELERLVCFRIIAATEGLLTGDFFERVYEKDKSDLGRIFRAVFNKSMEKDRPSLEQDIIENWKNEFPSKKKFCSAYLAILNYRHWLAHGRYWKLTYRAREYSMEETLKIAGEIFKIIKS